MEEKEWRNEEKVLKTCKYVLKWYAMWWYTYTFNVLYAHIKAFSICLFNGTHEIMCERSAAFSMYLQSTNRNIYTNGT